MENKGKTMMIVIIVLLTLLIATIIGVSFYAFKTFSANNNVNDTKVISQGKVLTPAEVYTYELANPIAVNLAVGTDGVEHAATVSVGISIDNTDKKESPSFITLIESQEVVVRDVIISVLRTKTVDEMRKLDSTEGIKQEILERLQAEFKTDLIYSVSFGNYYYD